jgi:hypothetical protein
LIISKRIFQSSAKNDKKIGKKYPVFTTKNVVFAIKNAIFKIKSAVFATKSAYFRGCYEY